MSSVPSGWPPESPDVFDVVCSGIEVPHARDACVMSMVNFVDGEPVEPTYHIRCRCGARLDGEGFSSVRLLWRWGEVHVCGVTAVPGWRVVA